MKKTLGVVAALIATLLAIAMSAPAAQAYPISTPPTFKVSANPTTVLGGHTFVGHAHASVRCHDWTLTFLQQSAHGAGKNFTHRFDTPVVQKKTVYPMHARCAYTLNGQEYAKSFVIPITVLPQHAQAGPPATNGVLPNTGGPNLWLLIAALALLLGGGGAVLRSRRRSTNGSA